MAGALKANCRCDCPAVAQHPLFSADITSVTLSPATPPPPFIPIQPVPALIIWAWLTCFYGSMVIVGLIKIFLKHRSVLVLAVAFLACSASCAIPVVRNFKFDVLCVYFPSDWYVRLLIIISFINSSALLAHKQKEYGFFCSSASCTDSLCGLKHNDRLYCLFNRCVNVPIACMVLSCEPWWTMGSVLHVQCVNSPLTCLCL